MSRNFDLTQWGKNMTCEDFEKQMMKEKCCACNCIIGENGKNINLVQLPRIATWEYPISGNLLTGTKNRAIAIVCNVCIENNVPINYAIRFDDGKIVRVPINDLVLAKDH